MRMVKTAVRHSDLSKSKEPHLESHFSRNLLRFGALISFETDYFKCESTSFHFIFFLLLKVHLVSHSTLVLHVRRSLGLRSDKITETHFH